MPKLDAFDAQLKGSGEREMSTTMAFVGFSTLAETRTLVLALCPSCRMKRVPSVWRACSVSWVFIPLSGSCTSQKMRMPDYAYRESEDGQVIEAGINEAGALSAWIAAGTSYSNHLHVPLVPFYIYYSMFGFQRVGDLPGLFYDSQTRGFCWAEQRAAPL